jgi:hypothetical protein
MYYIECNLLIRLWILGIGQRYINVFVEHVTYITSLKFTLANTCDVDPNFNPKVIWDLDSLSFIICYHFSCSYRCAFFFSSKLFLFIYLLFMNYKSLNEMKNDRRRGSISKVMLSAWYNKVQVYFFIYLEK